MSTTYGKWERGYTPDKKQEPCVRRLVTTHTYPLGFHRKRERWETVRVADNVGRARLCRVLNGEPEPEPKLDDRVVSDFGTEPGACTVTYHFSTEALKAELARRDKETPWFLSLADRRTGPSDRRKPAKRGKGRR